jgi:MFS family permease
MALACLAVIELRFSDEPMLELQLFGNRTFPNASVVGYVSVMALFGAEFIMPVYLQALRGLTALDSGIVLLPLAVAAGVVSPIAGRLYDAIGPRLLVTAGSAILIANTWLLRLLSSTTTTKEILVLMAMRGIAISLIMQPTYTTALGSVPQRSVPRGSSLVNSTRFIAQALGVAALATVLSASLSAESRRVQFESGRAASSQGLCDADGAGATVDGGRMVRQAACQEYLRGISRTHTVTLFAAIAALAIGVSLPGWPGPPEGRKRQS